MPVSVSCNTCAARLNVPERLAGKKIKCPKCQAILVVPAEDAVADALPQSAPPPMPPPEKDHRREEESRDRERDEQADDDEDVRDRPSRRKKRRARAESGGAGNGVSIGLGIGGLVLGLLAVVFSFIPFCGAIVAFPAGGLGFLLALIGIVVAFLSTPKSGLGIGLNGFASVLNLGAIGIAILWMVGIFGLQASTTSAVLQQAQKQQADAMKRMEEAHQKAQQQAQAQDNQVGPVQGPRTAAMRAQSQQNLKQLVLAMQNFAATNNGTLPPSKCGGGLNAGKLSWRVAILPFMEQQALYNKLKLNEAWDSPANKQVLDQFPMPSVFTSPAGDPGEDKKTYYQVFTGPSTPWPNDNAKPKLPLSFTDGTSATFLIVEARTPVYWTQAEDIRYSGQGIPPLGGIFGGEFNAAMADGSVHFFARGDYPPQAIQAYITPSGGEQVAPPH